MKHYEVVSKIIEADRAIKSRGIEGVQLLIQLEPADFSYFINEINVSLTEIRFGESSISGEILCMGHVVRARA